MTVLVPRLHAGALLLTILLLSAGLASAQSEPAKTTKWTPLPFVIIKLNEEPPISWNVYHSQKKGYLLVRLWKRYLLIHVPEEEVYEIDPKNVKLTEDGVEWSFTNLPDKPLETLEWKERNVGQLTRVRFKLAANRHYLEIQLPADLNGKPMY